MRLPFWRPRGREVADGATTRSPASSGGGGATVGAESGPLLELWRPTLGGVSQPASADVAGRGRPVHPGGAAVPNVVLRALPAGVSTRRGRRAGVAAQRVRARRDRAGRAAP